VSLAFGSPWMLWGAALVALPILIHLLNRRATWWCPFAAMSFLLAAFKSRRRRLRMENLLLLLLRCLLVLLAALAMALPFVPEDSPLAALSGGRRELVLIIDRSGSMGRLVAPGVTADDRVLESLRRRLGALSEERGDAVTLICMGAGNPLPAPIGATPAMALAALDGLPPPSGVADVLAAARLLADRVRPARPGASTSWCSPTCSASRGPTSGPRWAPPSQGLRAGRRQPAHRAGRRRRARAAQRGRAVAGRARPAAARGRAAGLLGRAAQLVRERAGPGGRALRAGRRARRHAARRAAAAGLGHGRVAPAPRRARRAPRLRHLQPDDLPLDDSAHARPARPRAAARAAHRRRARRRRSAELVQRLPLAWPSIRSSPAPRRASSP
jgi:hypothetical protein